MDEFVNESKQFLSNMLAKQTVVNNYLTNLENMQFQVEQIANRSLWFSTLDTITGDLGEIRAGAFYALSAGAYPTDADANGAFMVADGVDFGGDVYQIGGVNNGVLQFGLSSTTGKALAGGGAVTLDTNGISLDGSLNPSIIRLTNNNMALVGGADQFVVQTETTPATGETRVFQYGMVSNGVTNPEGVISFYEPGAAVTVPNGDFGSNTLTDWSSVAGGLDWSTVGSVYPLSGYATVFKSLWYGGNLYVCGKFGSDALIYKWDGSTWTALSSPDAAANNMYYDMKVDGTGKFWLCGINQLKGGSKGVITSWNGTTRTDYYDSNVVYLYELDIDSSNNVYAGGATTSGSSIIKYTASGATYAQWGSNMTQNILGLRIIGTNIYVSGDAWSYTSGVRSATLASGSFANYGTGMSTAKSRSLITVGTKLYAYGQDGLWVIDTSVGGAWVQKSTAALNVLQAYSVYDGSDVLYIVQSDGSNSLFKYTISTNTISYFGDNNSHDYSGLSYNSKIYIARIDDADTGILPVRTTTSTGWSGADGYASITSLMPTTAPELKTLITSGGAARIALSSGQNYTWSVDTYATGNGSQVVTLTVTVQYYAAATGGSPTATQTIVTRTGTGSMAWLTNKATLTSANVYAEIHMTASQPYGKITAGFDNFTITSASVTSLTFKDSGLYYTNAGTSYNVGTPALSGLSDVTITSPVSGQVLTYNGSKWVNGVTVPSASYLSVMATDFGANLSPFNGNNFNSGNLNDKPGEANHPGIQTIASTANPNSGYSINFGDSNNNQIILGGVEAFEIILRPLSNNSNIIARFGWQASRDNSTPANALAFYAAGNGTTWDLGMYPRNGGVGTVTNFTTLAMNTWYKLKMTNGGTGAVNLYVYNMSGTLLSSYNYTGTVTKNAMNFGAVAYRSNNVATDIVDIDYMSLYTTAPYTR